MPIFQPISATVFVFRGHRIDLDVLDAWCQVNAPRFFAAHGGPPTIWQLLKLVPETAENITRADDRIARIQTQLRSLAERGAPLPDAVRADLTPAEREAYMEQFFSAADLVEARTYFIRTWSDRAWLQRLKLYRRAGRTCMFTYDDQRFQFARYGVDFSHRRYQPPRWDGTNDRWFTTAEELAASFAREPARPRWP